MFPIFALITIAVITALVAPIQNSLASAVAVSSTPARKPAKKTPVKTINQITYTEGEYDGVEVVKTDAEWKKLLSTAAFVVMRQEGTERAYSGSLTNNHKHGKYYCAACGLALFKSNAKFESGTGWPSFFQPIYKKNVTEMVDNTLGEERTEVECARCHAHLGHVFDDGPQPTGLRYCMNSVALRFKEAK